MMNIPDNLEATQAEYDDAGVIRVRQLLPGASQTTIRNELDRYIREVAPSLPSEDIVFEADGVSVRNLWRMHEHDVFFSELAADPGLIGLVTKLLHGEPELMAVQAFNKPARIGSGIPPHQDNAYFCQSPPDVLTVWIAIDPATMDNGPVYYIRGSHKLGMLSHKPSSVKGNSMGLDADYDDSDPFIGTLDAGDALIHHCQIIHYSDPNTTEHPRCGLLMVFRGKHTQEDPELRNTYQMGGAAQTR